MVRRLGPFSIKIKSSFFVSASIDNLRLWNVAEAAEPDFSGKAKSGVQFKIIPGHHGGYISQMRE
jgi:transcriptional activator SPT8